MVATLRRLLGGHLGNVLNDSAQAHKWWRSFYRQGPGRAYSKRRHHKCRSIVVERCLHHLHRDGCHGDELVDASRALGRRGGRRRSQLGLGAHTSEERHRGRRQQATRGADEGSRNGWWWGLEDRLREDRAPHGQLTTNSLAGLVGGKDMPWSHEFISQAVRIYKLGISYTSSFQIPLHTFLLQ
jgi:hypothetical protein